jgi:hypothetical protein
MNRVEHLQVTPVDLAGGIEKVEHRHGECQPPRFGSRWCSCRRIVRLGTSPCVGRFDIRRNPVGSWRSQRAGAG